MVDRHSDSGWLVHIGAGLSSVSTLRQAREQGLRTIAIDIDPNAPGFAYASEVLERSRDDLDGILRDVRTFAAQHSIVGCSTTSSAPAALASAAAIREEHDLPGLRSAAMTLLADRSVWKNRLARRSISTPASALLSTPEELDQFLDEQPCTLVKPESGGRGSMGVAQVKRGEARNRDLFREAQDSSSSGLVLAEAFVTGNEFSVDGIICDGVFQMLHLGRKFSARNLRGILPTGYAWGAPGKNIRCDEEPRWHEYQALASATGRCLELDDTFMSLDVIDDGERSFIIDIGCQLDAKVDRALGFSGFHVAEIECAISTGTPLPSDYAPGALTRGYAIRFLYVDSEGRLLPRNVSDPLTLEASSRQWQEIPMPAYRIQVEWEKDEGAIVRRPRSVSDLVACVLIESEDRNQAWMRCNEIDKASLFSVRERLEGDSPESIESNESNESNEWSVRRSSSS